MNRKLCSSILFIIKYLKNKAKKVALIQTVGEWANFWKANVLETETPIKLCIEWAIPRMT